MDSRRGVQSRHDRFLRKNPAESTVSLRHCVKASPVVYRFPLQLRKRKRLRGDALTRMDEII